MKTAIYKCSPNFVSVLLPGLTENRRSVMPEELKFQDEKKARKSYQRGRIFEGIKHLLSLDPFCQLIS